MNIKNKSIFTIIIIGICFVIAITSIIISTKNLFNNFKAEKEVAVIKEPVITPPVVEKPVIPPPIVEEPIIPSPVVKEPVVTPPVVKEPVVPPPASNHRHDYGDPYVSCTMTGNTSETTKHVFVCTKCGEKFEKDSNIIGVCIFGFTLEQHKIV